MNAMLLSPMNHMKKLFFSFFFLSMVAVADAGTIVAPDGLLPGTEFRVIFVTAGKINSTSTNILTYDNFVNAQAMNANYEGRRVRFSAIASISLKPEDPAIVNAITHINTGMSSAAGVYMVDGTKVAENTGTTSGGLFSGNLTATPRQGIDGTVYQDVNVWTGTSGNGLNYTTALFGRYGLGSSNVGKLLDSPLSIPYFPTPMASVGRLGSADISGYSWLSAGGISGLAATSTELQLYAISDILTVSAPRLVPEPSCLMSLCVGALVLAVPRKFRRRVRESSQV